MRVHGQGPTDNTRRPENAARINEASRTPSSEGVDNSNEVTASDKVELSSQARDIQRAREVAQGAPEVRADKVEAARRAVQSGNLNLQGQELAKKLLEDSLPG
jgi:negative regulator of flagellin synthesis FlgM